MFFFKEGRNLSLSKTVDEVCVNDPGELFQNLLKSEVKFDRKVEFMFKHLYKNQISSTGTPKTSPHQNYKSTLLTSIQDIQKF